MKRIKKLLPLLVGATVLLGLPATAEAAGKFTASQAGLDLAEETLEEHEFEVTSSDLDCEVVSLEGITEGTAYVEQRVEPIYSSCDVSSLSAAVNTGGCEYTFNAETGTLGLSNCDNGGIIFDAKSTFWRCTVLIPNQTIVSAALYVNTSGQLDIILQGSSVQAEVVISTGLCPLTVGKHKNVPLNGESRVKAAGGTIGHDS